MKRTISEVSTVRDFLLGQFQLKVARNKQYSLRAFARDLGISSGRLTNLLQGNNIPSLKTLEKIRSTLGLDDERYSELLSLVEEEQLRNRNDNGHDIILDDRHLQLIVDWLPYAILSLSQTASFKMSIPAISERFAVSEKETETAIEMLRLTGLLVFSQGKWGPAARKITTSFDVPSSKIRQHHKSKMKLGIKKIDTIESSLRDFSSITFPANTKKIAKAKVIISQFRRNIAELFEHDKKCNEVYTLNIQLFPLTHARSCEISDQIS